MRSLAERQCIPCRGDVPPLTREQLAPLVAEIDEAWNVRDVPDARRGAIMMLTRQYQFKDFKDAMAFAARVGDLAEEQQHHPDLHVAWGKVRVDIWTHKIGGPHRKRRRLRRKMRRARSEAFVRITLQATTHFFA